MPRVRRVRVVVGAASTLGVGLMLTLGHLAWVDVEQVRGPVPPQTADLLEAVVVLAALPVLAWLLLAVIASALAAAPSRASVRAGWIAARIAPGALRKGLAAVVLSGAVVSVAPSAAMADDGVTHGAAPTSVLLSPTSSGTEPRTDEFTAPDPAPSPSPAPATEQTVTDPEERAQDSPEGPRQLDDGRTPVGLGPLRPPARVPSSDTVVVRPGDCLWSLAARHLGPKATEAAIAAEWPRWYAANRDVVGDDPHLLLPGLRLRIPAAQ